MNNDSFFQWVNDPSTPMCDLLRADFKLSKMSPKWKYTSTIIRENLVFPALTQRVDGAKYLLMRMTARYNRTISSSEMSARNMFRCDTQYNVNDTLDYSKDIFASDTAIIDGLSICNNSVSMGSYKRLNMDDAVICSCPITCEDTSAREYNKNVASPMEIKRTLYNSSKFGYRNCYYYCSKDYDKEFSSMQNSLSSLVKTETLEEFVEAIGFNNIDFQKGPTSFENGVYFVNPYYNGDKRRFWGSIQASVEFFDNVYHNKKIPRCEAEKELVKHLVLAVIGNSKLKAGFTPAAKRIAAYSKNTWLYYCDLYDTKQISNSFNAYFDVFTRAIRILDALRPDGISRYESKPDFGIIEDAS